MNTVANGHSVLHVLWSGGVGGVERLVVDLAATQMERGDDVGVAFAQAEGPFAKSARERGLPVHDLGLRSGYDLGPRSRARIIRVMRDNAVVHLHGFNVPLSRAATRSGRPIVFTDHGSTPPNRLAPIARVKRSERHRFLRNAVDVLVANSHFTAGRLAETGIALRAPVRIVHNGLDLKRFAGPRPRTAGVSPVAMCVSRLVGLKRVHLVIDALALTRDPTLKAIVVGDGPARQSLESRARTLGVAEQVQFVGFRNDVDSLLVTADLLVHPCSDEAFGLTVLEASAHGLLPIVFSDGGGVLEIIPPDASVVDDAAGLAAVLTTARDSRLLEDGARRARSEWARRTFPITRTADQYAELYATLPSRSGAGD